MRDARISERWYSQALCENTKVKKDIDKDYMMTYGLLPDGALPTLSDLELERNPKNKKLYNPQDILALNPPEGRTFNFRRDTTNSGISVSDVESIKSDIKNLNKILQLPAHNGVVNVYVNRDVSEEDYQWLKNLCKKHEQSKRSGNVEMLATQNTIVRGIMRVLEMPDTQINMSNPVTMDDLKHEANKSALAAAEKTMTLDNPFTKFMMQEQNMVGRSVIGIGAVSLKAFFEASAFFNQQISETESLIENFNKYGGDSVKNEILENILDLLFDNKFNGTIQTLANLDFFKLKNLLFKHKELWNITITGNLAQRLAGQGKDGLFVPTKLNEKEYTFVTFNGPINPITNEQDVVSSTIHLYQLVEYLDQQSNGSWDDPIDASFALGQLINAATDNAKALILSKINATTKFADVWTYLMTIGMSVRRISNLMVSPIFNIVAQYAQSDIYDKNSKGSSLKNALSFVLDKSTLNPKDNMAFNWVLTHTNDITERSTNTATFLERLVFKTSGGKIVFDGMTEVVKENNVIFRWYESTLPEGEPDDQDVDTILTKVRNVVFDGFDKNRHKNKPDFQKLLDMIYEELRLNKDAQNALIDVLLENIHTSTDMYDVDPEYLLSTLTDIDDEIPETEDDLDVDAESFSYKGLDEKTARYLYKYVTTKLFPKNEKIKDLISDKRQDLSDLLNNVLPATEEQQMNGTILSINQGIKTKDYDEYSWIRRINNFVNQRYLQSDILDNPEAFDLLLFLEGGDYQTKQIDQYEKVKSTVNILKSLIKTPHFKEMMNVASVNRRLIERSSAIRMERVLADLVMETNKSKRGQISSGFWFKFNRDEFKALQEVVSDTLIMNWLQRVNGLKIQIPAEQTYYSRDNGHPTKSSATNQPILDFSDSRDLSSFKRLMDDYIIPKLIEEYGNENSFFANLTTGFKRNAITTLPNTFYKPAFNISDVSKSPKLQNLYDGVARDFNKVYNNVVKIGETVWTIGDLFYLYNLVVHKERLGGNTFTKLFEEMTTSKDRHSLVWSFNDFLGKLDNGEYRWNDVTIDKNGYTIHFGDYVTVDLRDVRLRCCVNENSEKKMRVHRELNVNGRVIKISMTDTDNKVIPNTTRELTNRTILNDTPIYLPYYQAVNTKSNKSIALDSNEKIPFAKNSRELLIGIVDNLKNRFGSNVPIQVVDSNIIDELTKSGILPDSQNIRMKGSHGFVWNGVIYINSDDIDISAPIHELMHVICAAMKYGNNSQRTLFYKLLDDITPNKPKYATYYKDVKDYDLVGSDLKEEVLIRYMTDEVMDNFESIWNSIENANSATLYRGIQFALEQVLACEFSGTVKIQDILDAPIGQAMAVFHSQFIGTDQQRVVRTIVPTNQKLAALKKHFRDNKKLDINGDC